MDVIASLLFFQDTIASHGMRDLKKTSKLKDHANCSERESYIIPFEKVIWF